MKLSVTCTLAKLRDLIRYLPAILCLLSGIAAAQSQTDQISFSHINYEQGLSNSTVEAIAQDNRGFIWIGTRDGLNKYDGYQMTVFRHDRKNPSSISDNYIRFVCEDKQKTLWIGTTNGLNRFSQEDQTFSRYQHRSDDPHSISGNYINCIMEDSRHQLWICTGDGGLNVLDRRTGVFRHFTHTGLPGSLSSNTVHYITEDSKGVIWVATSKGLNRYHPENGTFASYLTTGYTPFKVISEDTVGRLWIATEGSGLVVFDPRQRTVRNFRHNDRAAGSLGNDLVLSLLITRKGQVWAGTINGGLNLFRPRSEDFTNYTNEPGNPSGLSQRTISALFEDKQGNLWIGTHRGGLNLYTPAARKFNIYRQESGPQSLSYNDVKCFEEDRSGRIWIGTDGGGLNLFDQENRSFTAYRHRSTDPRSLGSDAVLDVTEDSKGRLWIATWGGGLNLMHPETGTFTRYKHDPSNPASISSDFVQNIFQDGKDNLWAGTYFGGLNRFDPLTGTFTRTTFSPDGKTAMKGNNVVSLYQDDDGNLWIGTDDGGLNCLNSKTGRFEHYFDRLNKKPDIRVIFQDSRRRLWIGHEGLYLFSPRTKTFRIFTTKAGLDHAFIKGIEEDRNGNFWISTSAGIIRLHPDNLQTRRYNTSDGLQAMEFEAGASLKTRRGQLFFGGVNGFNTFRPEDIRSNPWIPPVYITGLQVFNEDIRVNDPTSILKKDISYTGAIRLNHKQSSISFTFAALNYLATANNQYAYMLSGFDKDWNYSGSDRKATYTNLDPGTYVFRVKASNNDGLWNEKGAFLKVIITPPWWQTWWFRALLTAAVIGSAYAIHVYRKNQQIKKLNEEKKEELHQMQLQFFTNISHEFRTPLTLISGPVEKLLDTEKRSDVLHAYHQVLRNAARLMNLVNELMDFRKVESGILNLKVIPGNINVFLKEITAEFHDWADQKNVTFSIQNTPQPDASVYFDRQILEKILLNLINNAFKYTPDGGRIQIKLFFSANEFSPAFSNELKITHPYQAKEYMYILVADSGIGISAESIGHLFQRYYRITSSHLGSGIGLAFVKTLVTLHKGHISVYSERNKGTEFLLALPFREEDYTAGERWINDDKNLLLESLHSEWHTAPVVSTGITSPKTLPDTGGKKILIVEDNTELRSFLKESLEDHYHITEADNGHEGLQRAGEHPPDLIISDVMMPGMNGIEFCRLIRKNERLAHIPFILLTAKDTLESRLEGIGSGADFYFSKPVSINLLLLSIRNIFQHEEQLRERHIRDYYSEIKEAAGSDKDKQFIDHLSSLIESQIVNPDLDVDYLCNQLNMSRTKLYELIKRISGQSIVEFIRTIRLNKAMHLLTHDDLPLSEIMFRVGIQTQSYFTKAFKKEFGKTPTQFLKELKR